MKTLIVAGGKGTRLWPLSKPGQPKQLQRLLSDKSLLQDTVARVLPLVQPTDIYLVVSNEFQVKAVHEQLPDIPTENILQEPYGRNTAAAVSFGTEHIIKLHGNDTIILTLWADHFIDNPTIFQSGISQAEKYLTAHPDELVLIGVKPTYPETGYGYIKFENNTTSDFKKVVAFTEKPSVEFAAQYILDGNYLWNAGMFVWRAGTLMQAFSNHAPQYSNLSNEAYKDIPAISLDDAVLKLSHNLTVLPLNLGWRDVGHWAALREHFKTNDQQNVVEGKHLTQHSTGNYIVNRSGRTIATVGINNLIIVDTDKELLICHPDYAQYVKDIAEEIEKEAD